MLQQPDESPVHLGVRSLAPAEGGVEGGEEVGHGPAPAVQRVDVDGQGVLLRELGVGAPPVVLVPALPLEADLIGDWLRNDLEGNFWSLRNLQTTKYTIVCPGIFPLCKASCKKYCLIR